MSEDTMLWVFIFMLIVLFGTMIGTNQIAKLDKGYVAIPSNRYCEGLGYVKSEPARGQAQ
jgi:hypothetical protein